MSQTKPKPEEVPSKAARPSSTQNRSSLHIFVDDDYEEVYCTHLDDATSILEKDVDNIKKGWREWCSDCVRRYNKQLE